VDRETFDALTRRLAGMGSRRTALGALVGTGLTGVLGRTEANAKRRSTQRGKRKQRKRQRRGDRAPEAVSVSVEAVRCEPPRHSANLRNCDYSGRNLTGVDLHASTLTDARFVGTNLCGAKLSSSQLRRADFTNANLTNADLHSSGCAGADFTGATFCNTIDCNGNLRIDSCDSPADACCGCAAGQCCAGGACVAGDTSQQCGGNGAPCRACGTCERCVNGTCQPLKANGSACSQTSECCSGICQGRSCVATLAGTCPPGADSCTGPNATGFTLCGNDLCACRQTVTGDTLCGGNGRCADCADCQPGEVCVRLPDTGPCCGPVGDIKTACMEPCPPQGSSCFVAGTRVAMADGTSRPIEQVAVGDRVLGRDGVNRVVAIERPRLGTRRLYALNGGPFFVTAEHPFLSEDGWKAVDPAATLAENPALIVGRLAVGDRLLALAGVAVLAAAGGGAAVAAVAPRLAAVPLGSLIGMEGDPATPLYNLRLDGDHAYFADDLLVHNK
jgi:hypothetical protein